MGGPWGGRWPPHPKCTFESPENTWKVFKELLNKQEIKETIEPDIMNKEKANRFNHYFATIGTEIKNKLGITDTHVESQSKHSTECQLFNFQS